MKIGTVFDLQERSLKAFLDLAILMNLAEKPMTGYELNRRLTKRFGILIGPGMIYSKIYLLERHDLIKRFSKTRKAYCLTEKGKEVVDSKKEIAAEICGITKLLFGNIKKKEQ